MSDCIFCKIIEGEIPSDCVYEDEVVFAFRDINPQAPVHILIVPKEHIESVADLTEGNCCHASECLLVADRIARAEGLERGYRIITNTGPDSGQTVHHLHFHLLGGKTMGTGLGIRD